MKILLLEDVLFTCNMLSAIMECMFPEDTLISCSMSCKEFNEIFHIINPNLVLIDFLQPEKDGAECFAQLFDQTTLSPCYPVIYYSAIPKKILTKKINSYYSTHNIKHDNYTILSKPFSLEEFYEAIHRVITPTLKITYHNISKNEFLRKMDDVTKGN